MSGFIAVDTVGTRVEQRVTVRCLDLGDGKRFDPFAVAGERQIGIGELERRDVSGAERDRRLDREGRK